MTGGDIGEPGIRDLLSRVGMLREGGEVRRSDPLRDPAAFHELARRLFEAVDRPFDVVVVRDLFGDRVLGYELGLMAGRPVAVSHDREGVIGIDPVSIPSGARAALIAADTHFTAASIQAAALGVRQAGIEVAGAAILLEQLAVDYGFPVWRPARADRPA
jgi:hypothetical protein